MLDSPALPKAFDGFQRFAVARPTDSQRTKPFTTSKTSCRIASAFSVDLSVDLKRSIWTDSANKFIHTVTHPRWLRQSNSRLNKRRWRCWFCDVTRASFLDELALVSTRRASPATSSSIHHFTRELHINQSQPFEFHSCHLRRLRRCSRSRRSLMAGTRID